MTDPPKWEEITDSVVKELHPDMAENDIYSGTNKYFRDGEAHLYMQLINWSALGHPSPGVGFDPKNDPFPEDPDTRDEEGVPFSGFGSLSVRGARRQCGSGAGPEASPRRMATTARARWSAS